MKTIIILGASGSIGLQALDIIQKFPDKYKLVGCSIGSDLVLGKKIINEFQPNITVVRDLKHKNIIDENFECDVLVGDSGLAELSNTKVDVFLNALSGSVGLIPTINAIKTGSNIALANKETLVMAGHIIMPLIKQYNVKLFPVDSEHSAIWQCLQGEESNTLRRVIITASGGAFRDKSIEDLHKVTVEDALKHPNWSMGSKITIDSATMMNKGLEVIEAAHLFSLDYDCIDTIMHRESIIHSLVEFSDSSIKAQLGIPDMSVQISYALYYPERLNLELEYLDFSTLSKLSFESIDLDKYPCLKYAYEAGRKGGIYPAILNASNEAAVSLFLEKKIRFTDIQSIVLAALKDYGKALDGTLDEIIEVDALVKKDIYEKYDKEDYLCGF